MTLFLQCELVDNREVSTEEGRALAENFGEFGVPFFEVSAKSLINVDKPFYELVGQVMYFVARCPCALPVSRADAFRVQVREMRHPRKATALQAIDAEAKADQAKAAAEAKAKVVRSHCF